MALIFPQFSEFSFSIQAQACKIKFAGFNVDLWRLPILDNGLTVTEVAEDDFD